MSDQDDISVSVKEGMLAPFGERAFRTIWIGSLFSNLGQLVQWVGASREMARMGASPEMIALVQNAMMMPGAFFALAVGTLADMFDKRKIALLGYGFSTVCAAALLLFTMHDFLTPSCLLPPASCLLVFCFLIGTGAALFGPAWQSSIGEQVNRKNVPAAIAPGTISYNAARSIGPAIGGAVVGVAGAAAAFAINRFVIFLR